MSVFGAVCSGRPMILAEQVDQTKFVINVPNASNISYITIFILPNSPFTDNNITALIYFQLPNTSTSPGYKLLGGINPSKPSAIYKLNTGRKTTSTNTTTGGDDMEMESNDSPIDLNDSVSINIGISIEPTAQAEQLIQNSKQGGSSGNSQSLVRLTPNIPNASNKPQDTAVLANKIVGHAYNFLASFIDPQGKVPIKAFDNWWDKFKAKLQNNPNFLNEIQD